MREIPILFSTPMVQAILEGRKTQTRRALKYQPPDNTFLIGPETYVTSKIDKYGELVEGKEIYGAYADGYDWGIKAPYQPGDILWVRETWAYSPNWYYIYLTDNNEAEKELWNGKIKWRPSIHMPREAARLFLLVKNIRVERLWDITEVDARAEGCITFHDKIGDGKFEDVAEFDLTAKDAFADLWDSIYKNWAENPFVWVIEFERIKDYDAGKN